MHLAQFCPEAYKLEEGLWYFKELTGQVEMAKLTTKKQLTHYFRSHTKHLCFKTFIT